MGNQRFLQRHGSWTGLRFERVNGYASPAGLIYFLVTGFGGEGFPASRIFHLLILLAAAALMHVPARLKALGDKLRFSYSIVSILGALVLVFVGISVL
ncbi:MAG TPA: hypothetical protein VLM78_10100 [Anaerolineales bacterium]|nr:hypothetical protein [Anaerolineales bacterium]